MADERARSLEGLRNGLKKHAAGRLFLGLLSVFYLAGAKTREALYSAGLLARKCLSARVVCFGNLSSGGTGKTSAVAEAALALKHRGFNPAVLIRGYKRRAPKNKATVLRAGEKFSADEAGDEALVLSQLLKDSDVPVLVCADRVLSGRMAIEEFKSDILLMDDGFQFFALKRDADVVFINAAAPFYADAPLPLGNLRESPSGLKRARAVVISHCERVRAESLERLRSEIKKINPAVPVIESAHSPDGFINAVTGETLPPAAFRGRAAVALSGIGDPESFEKILAALGIRLAHVWRYPDHHRFAAGELPAAQNAGNGLPLITTRKDFARFPENWARLLNGGVFILSVKMIFPGNGYNILMDAVAGKKEG